MHILVGTLDKIRQLFFVLRKLLATLCVLYIDIPKNTINALHYYCKLVNKARNNFKKIISPFLMQITYFLLHIIVPLNYV